MADNKNGNNCLYNLIYTNFNEDFSKGPTFYYDLQYPSFFNFNNGYFYTNPNYLNNINSLIKQDVLDFRDQLSKEESYYNSTVADDKPNEKKIFSAFSNYAVTFNKNHLLSVINTLTGDSGGVQPTYRTLYNYNYDLLTGNEIALKNIFNDGVDYIKVITDYVNYKINQDKDLYLDDVDIFITDDQAFYLDDDGLIIYFDQGSIAPKEFGTSKFKLSFKKFAPYINPRFYCDATNLKRRMFRR